MIWVYWLISNTEADPEEKRFLWIGFELAFKMPKLNGLMNVTKSNLLRIRKFYSVKFSYSGTIYDQTIMWYDPSKNGKDNPVFR